MINSAITHMLRVIGCCLMGACALAWQLPPKLSEVRRVYVEPFKMKGESDNLQHEIVSQLRKLNSVEVVSSPSNADGVLSGEGEIWIRGYESLNPRSGRSPSNGNPIYGGFVSVELKDPQGETIWSYLASPHATSGDFSKELSKQVVKHFKDARNGSNSRSLSNHQ